MLRGTRAFSFFVVLSALLPNLCSTGCPCIDHSWTGSNYLVSSGCVAAGTDTTMYCFPETYGTGATCSSFDSGLGDCDVSSPASNCALEWCYVNPDNCDVQLGRSQLFPGEDLYYSYQACGSADYARDTVAQDSLRGVSLRYAYPAPLRPLHFRDASGQWAGLVPEWLALLQRQAGFILVEKQVSETSLSMFASKWDACVHDVAMGLLDFCASTVQASATRAGWADFSAPLRVVLYRLWVPKALEVVWTESLVLWLSPFDTTAWLMVIGATITTVVTYWWLEGGASCVGCRKLWKMRKKNGLSKREERKRANAVAKCRFCMGTFGKAFYYTSQTLFSMSVVKHPPRNATRILLLAYGFFVLIIVSSYTANLAANLSRNIERGIDNIQDADNNRLTICVEKNVVDGVQKMHPNLKVRVTESSTQLVTDVADGLCDGSIVPETDALLRDDYQSCDRRFAGGGVVSNIVAIPVASAYEKEWSFLTTMNTISGDYEQLFQKWRAKSDCPYDETQETNDATSLSWQALMGPFFFWGVLAFVAVLWRSGEQLRKKKNPFHSGLSTIRRIQTYDANMLEFHRQTENGPMEEGDLYSADDSDIDSVAEAAARQDSKAMSMARQQSQNALGRQQSPGHYSSYHPRHTHKNSSLESPPNAVVSVVNTNRMGDTLRSVGVGLKPKSPDEKEEDREAGERESEDGVGQAYSPGPSPAAMPRTSLREATEEPRRTSLMASRKVSYAPEGPMGYRPDDDDPIAEEESDLEDDGHGGGRDMGGEEGDDEREEDLESGERGEGAAISVVGRGKTNNGKSWMAPVRH
uniref:Ionotropic glutamate receptor C-terminal domain-containing protein n=1 Tax=Chromera velia CCMP2878 TaxID=1169474 RepID=A0A0G4G8L7_9ALVE|eukprot:Cvel_20735.t1-p1 / transcript=Cvel_20735.t1 / gene=Cvel_20735 / organism=Chromera_velia_CCMP2878 / gene_product=Glutamate receptor ionotropic, kainate 1, putative / transcript_product=Glutamate receptor ionotropic, kainate 1, putative / location=Cvel_scaffold1888:26414-33953(-) / protein_length=809 / sequence_SO=supercontig / SO=protein_coding / is_pseudo=false